MANEMKSNTQESKNRLEKRKERILESGLTSTEERRKLRRSERELNYFMKDHANELVNPDSSYFTRATERLQNLYSNVCFPREANLDAANLVEISDAIEKQAEQLLSSDLTKYDAAVFVQKLGQRVIRQTRNPFEWNKLGLAVGTYFKRSPQTDFISCSNGEECTVTQQQPRKRTQRTTTDTRHVQESQPTDFSTHHEYRHDRKDAQACRLKRLLDEIKQRASDQKASMFEFVMNPNSFAETVENIFDFSFLVRNAEIALSMDDQGFPVVVDSNHENPEYETNFPEAKQAVIELTHNTWREIVQGLNIQEPYVGSRSQDRQE